MTTLIPLTQISIAQNRQRREFKPDSINELADSIVTNGLLQCPVLRIDGDQFILVAGERRLRAMTDLHELGRPFMYNGHVVPEGQIPFTTLGRLDPLEAWEAELEENIRRVDLTWQEKAQATAALMELRSAQAADRGEAPPRVADLTREVRDVPADTPDGKLGDAATMTRNELIVTRFLSDDEVSKAPSLKEAMKILKKREDNRQRTELATLVGKTFSTADHRLLNEDCLAWMAGAQPAQFDIILTDPPYGMGADTFGDSGVGQSASAHFYEDSYETWLEIMQVFPARSWALAKPEAHCYVFCDFDRFAELRSRMSEAGWKVHRTPLIWSNPDGFRAPWPEQGCQRKYELILYAVKGDRKVNQLKGDVLEYRKDASVGHPAQKPVPLLLDLLRRSARPGDAVFDPFAGSGATIEACHELKLSCTAIERDASAYGIAVKRVQQLNALEEALF